MPQEKLTEEEIEKVCPIKPTWAAQMISVVGARGKLAPLAECPSVKEELEKIKKGLA